MGYTLVNTKYGPMEMWDGYCDRHPSHIQINSSMCEVCAGEEIEAYASKLEEAFSHECCCPGTGGGGKLL